MNHTDPDEENTATTGRALPRRGPIPNVARPVPGSSALTQDVHELLGLLMASVARLETKHAELAPLAGEVAQLRRDIELDRGDLVHDASKSAAKHSSNRLAILMGALFSMY